MGKLFDRAKEEINRRQQREDAREKQSIAILVEEILGSEWVPLLEFSPSPVHDAVLDKTISIFVSHSNAYFYPLCPSCGKNPAKPSTYPLSWETIATEVEHAMPCTDCSGKEG